MNMFRPEFSCITSSKLSFDYLNEVLSDSDYDDEVFEVLKENDRLSKDFSLLEIEDQSVTTLYRSIQLDYYDDSVFKVLEENDKVIKNAIYTRDQNLESASTIDVTRGCSTTVVNGHKKLVTKLNSWDFIDNSNTSNILRLSTTPSSDCPLKNCRALSNQRNKLTNKNPFKTLRCNILKYHGYKGRKQILPKLLETPIDPTTHISKEIIASEIIIDFWQRYLFTSVFKYLRELVHLYAHVHPALILRPVNPLEASLIDTTSKTHVRFRLGGQSFPPIIFYKIFTKGSVVNMCSKSYPSVPKEKSQPNPNIPSEYNNWRPYIDWQLKISRPIRDLKQRRSGTITRVNSNSWQRRHKKSFYTSTQKEKQHQYLQSMKMYELDNERKKTKNMRKESSNLYLNGPVSHESGIQDENVDRLLNWARDVHLTHIDNYL